MEDSLRVEIERYLAGGMTSEETEAFLLKVRADSEAMALLGRALEDQAYLFDAARALPRRIPRARRFRSWLSSDSRTPIGLIAAIAAGALILVVGIALSGRAKRPETSAPQPVAIRPEDPVPEAPPPAPRRLPESPRPEPQRPAGPPDPVPAPDPRPAPQPTPEPPRVPKPEEPPAPRETRVAPAPAAVIGSIERVVGEVSPAAGALVAGQSVRTGPKASALVRLRRATVEVGEGALLEEVSDGRRRFRLSEGAVSVDVAPGAQDPVVIVTKQAELTVLGTKFRLVAAADATRLEVTQGRVRLQRLSDKSAVEVKAGQFAVAGAGELVARPLPIDEILLHAAHGVPGGGEWRIVPDPEASSGRAFESLKTANRPPNFTGDTSRVTFTFRADADRDYHVWVRGRTLATEKHIERDAVILDFGQALVTERPGTNKGVAGGGERALFNGFMHESGYWWIGGDADGKNDAVPVVVRFTRPGFQTLRMYAYETPVRIDAIWISALQKSRPDAGRK